MKENTDDLIKKICEKQNYDEILKRLIKIGKENKINEVLKIIETDNDIEDRKKRKIYEKLFEYVSNINEELKENVERIFEVAVKETINQLTNNERRIMEVDQIKVIIADDNKPICEFIKKYLEQYEEIKILGVANTDEEEVEMIENLKPDIVITDLMRNHKYTGLEIIKEYYKKRNSPEFLVISAELEQNVIKDGLEVAGYIKKPFSDYKIIVKELKRIKKELIEKGNQPMVKQENKHTKVGFIEKIIGFLK